MKPSSKRKPGRRVPSVEAQNAGAERLTRTLVGVCVGIAAFAATIQVADHEDDDLEGLGESDLVQLYSGYGAAAIRSRIEIAELEDRLSTIRSATKENSARLNDAEVESMKLSILAGDVPVKGPGIVIEIEALPSGSAGREAILALINEMRVASAEAIEINGVRIGLSVAINTATDGVSVGEVNLSAPYTVKVIGAPLTLAGATNFPTGAIRQLTDSGYKVGVNQEDRIEITSTTAVG